MSWLKSKEESGFVAWMFFKGAATKRDREQGGLSGRIVIWSLLILSILFGYAIVNNIYVARKLAAAAPTSITLPSLPVTSFTDLCRGLDGEFGRPPELHAPAGHPPLKIVIGANEWTVHYTTVAALDRRSAWAFEDAGHHRIWLPARTKEKEAQELLLHEILHATLAESRDGVMGEKPTYGPDENSFIAPMTPFLLDVLRDNPELVEWLRRGR